MNSKKKIEYFKIFNGKLFAIMNCKGRPRKNDALIMNALSERQITIYNALKKENKTDEEIFDILFPPAKIEKHKKEGIKIAVNPDMLNKKQLAELINKKIDTPLSSLQKMSKEDLKQLLLTLD